MIETDPEKSRRQAAEWFARMRGEPRDEDVAAFDRWMAADPENASAYRSIESTWEQAALLRRTAVGRGRPLAGSARPRRISNLAVAAGIAAAVGLGGAVAYSLRTVSAAPGAQPFTLNTALYEIRRFGLPDGSRVTLDRDSSLRVEFDRRARRVTLGKGRARFLVKREGRPFIVAAGSREVLSPAGEFDVVLEDRNLTVIAFTGPVSVSVPGSAAETAVAPGRKWASVRPGGSVAAGEREGQWVSGMLEFDQTPLAEAIVEANRYSGSHIRLGSKGLERLKVTGAFRTGDTPGLARSLAAAFHLRTRREEEDIVLLR